MASVEPVRFLWIVLKQEKVTTYNIIFKDVDKKPKNNVMFKNLAPFTSIVDMLNSEMIMAMVNRTSKFHVYHA